MEEFVNRIMLPTADGHVLKIYGLFHCVFFVLTLAAMVAAVIYTLKKGDKALYTLYVVSSIVLWIGEIYKQFCFSFKTGKFSYEWYSFPFQFCSTPLYTFLFCAIAKKGKAYDAVTVYNATYAFFAGTAVMLYPSTLVNNYGISFQSLTHHAFMMITGVSAFVAYGKRMSVKLFLQNMAVYTILLVIAMILNYVIPAATGQAVNMYFISGTYAEPNNPFGIFQRAYPYPLFVAVYYLLFTELACAIAYLSYVVATKREKHE